MIWPFHRKETKKPELEKKLEKHRRERNMLDRRLRYLESEVTNIRRSR